METELKLLLRPDDRQRVPALEPLQAAEPEQRVLENRYFDTASRYLSSCGMALRLRKSNNRWVQTLKGAGRTEGGLHQRAEWELPVAGPALELARFPAGSLPDNLDGERLLPLFTTDFSRLQWLLRHAAGTVEVAMDYGVVVGGTLSSPLCELELELVEGSPRVLFDLAEAIARELPVLPSDINKAERGYRLLSGDQSWPGVACEEATSLRLLTVFSRQAEALPDSAKDMVKTLQALVAAKAIHVGLAEPIVRMLREQPVNRWYELPDIQRLGQWLLHALRQSSL